jgi:hypothetical protein
VYSAVKSRHVDGFARLAARNRPSAFDARRKRPTRPDRRDCRCDYDITEGPTVGSAGAFRAENSAT